MDFTRSLEPILRTFVQHLERLQRDGRDPSDLVAFLESQCNRIASDPPSKHLPSIFRYQFKRMAFEFMMRFLHENIPSTSLPSHIPVNGASKKIEDAEFACKKDKDPIHPYVKSEDDFATDESGDSEEEIVLGQYLKEVAVDSVHHPMV